MDATEADMRKELDSEISKLHLDRKTVYNLMPILTAAVIS